MHREAGIRGAYFTILLCFSVVLNELRMDYGGIVGILDCICELYRTNILLRCHQTLMRRNHFFVFCCSLAREHVTWQLANEYVYL